MSIFTKTLVVLLCVFSLLLVGMTVIFVGNEINYKDAVDNQKTLNTSLQSELTTLKELFNTQKTKNDSLDLDRLQQIQDLQNDKNLLETNLRKTERLAQQYQAQADSWKGVMTGFEQSVRNLQASLSQTQQQLDQAREQGISDQKELNQITAVLYEQTVQIQSLEAERRRLLEQKLNLEQQVTTGVREIIPVTQPIRTATPVSPAVSVGNNIQGVITNVSQNLVTLSVGSADGVQENMVFHVTRGDRFLCDVVITNVDINQCAGILDLVQQQPQVNDTASTQL